MRGVASAILVACAAITILRGQGPTNATLLGQLKRIFPAATSFSPKEGSPPHFKAYAGTGGAQTVIGYAFLDDGVAAARARL